MDPYKTVTDKLNDVALMPFEWVSDKVKDAIVNFTADFITITPLLIGVSIGVYALINMFSSRLASLAVKGVFVYGALLVIVL
ncbi:hypothetical protein ACLIA0_06385 [Bacillaceae bacterium W0354]